MSRNSPCARTNRDATAFPVWCVHPGSGGGPDRPGPNPAAYPLTLRDATAWTNPRLGVFLLHLGDFRPSPPSTQSGHKMLLDGPLCHVSRLPRLGLVGEKPPEQAPTSVDPDQLVGHSRSRESSMCRSISASKSLSSPSAIASTNALCSPTSSSGSG